jgi:WD40 repeat protein
MIFQQFRSFAVGREQRRATFPAVSKLVAAAALAFGAAVLAVAAPRDADQQAGRPPAVPNGHPIPVAAPPVGRQDGKPAVDLHGDPLPPHAVARLGTLRFRGTNTVQQAAAVPGGKQLLGLGFEPAGIVLWDATSGKEIRRFERPGRRPAPKEAGVPFYLSVSFGSFAVSPDGRTLVAATVDESGLDCPMLLYDLATGRKLAEWPGHPSQGRTGYPHLAFVTPTLLVSAGDSRIDGSVRVWDVSKGREIRRLPLPAGSQVSAIEPSPNREQIFIAAWEKEQSFWMAWEVATGKLVHQEIGLPGVCPKLALSPDGKSLALAMGTIDPKECTEMRVYSGPGWKERRRWQAHDGEDAGRCSVAFSPDGKTIATGGADGKVRRWDAATGKELGPAIEPHRRHCQNVAYLDADTLFTFGWQEPVNFWDRETAKPKRLFVGAEWQITALAYSPDGRHLATGGDDGEPIRVWEAASGKQVALLRDGIFDVTCLRFSPDGTSLISGDYGGSIRWWEWAKGSTPAKRHVCENKGIVRCSAFSPDGKSLAAGDDVGMVRVCAVSSGRLLHTLEALGADGQLVTALAFFPDGQTLLACSPVDGVHQWDLTTGKEVRRVKHEQLGHANSVSGLATSPAGRWVYSASYDGSISVWEAASGRLARILKEKTPDCNGPVSIALSPDGTRLAACTGDWDDLRVNLWDLTNGQKAVFTGHWAPVTRLAFSPDGRRLASGSADTTVLVWEVTRPGSGGKVPEGKVLASLWKDLGADDPRVVYAAVCQSALAGDAAVARLKLDLKPAAVMDAHKVAGWVRQLDADEFVLREQASQALADLGPAAETALREALTKAPSREVRQRLQRILAGQEGEHRRLGHALEVLEMIATPAARSLLADLAKGATGSRLTRDALMALDRLERRP